MDSQNIGEQITVDILENISGADFNKIISSLPVFSCKKCLGILTPPIILVNNVGNVCGKCATRTPTALRNSALEMILEKLLFACPNENQGCKVKLGCDKISTHESVCNYRAYSCPWKAIQHCRWSGCFVSLHDHCVKMHSDSFRFETKPWFVVDVDRTRYSEKLKLFCYNKMDFILRMKCNPQRRKLQLIMCCISKGKAISDSRYTVLLPNSNFTDERFQSLILQEDEIPNRFIPGKSLTIDLSNVDSALLQSRTVFCLTIKIFLNDNHPEEIDEDLLRNFECPVCSNFMKGPIFLCLNGHSVCSQCKPSLKQCPICRVNFGNARNFVLEQLSSNVRFPCIYRYQGCRVALPGTEITKHEHECDLRLYGCPYGHCDWEGPYSEIIDHLRTHPRVEIIDGNLYLKYTDVTFSLGYKLCYMVAYDRIFRVCNETNRNKSTSWSVKMIGPAGEAAQYKYEIGFVDNVNLDIQHSRTEICQEFKYGGQSVEKSMVVPLEVLRTYSSNYQCLTYCKISRIVASTQKETILNWLSKQKPDPRSRQSALL